MNPPAPAFAANQVLFGHDDTPRIVAVETVGDDQVRVYRREADGAQVTVNLAPLEPFLWVTEPVVLQDAGLKIEYLPLQGPGELKFLARFQSWPDFQTARKQLDRSTHFALNDPVQQYLLSTGRTLFKGLAQDELHRLRVAVTTDGAGRLTRIALADSRGWCADLTGPETQMLTALVDQVVERDPDVIEGHDLFRATLETIHQRARANRVQLKLGRDGSRLAGRASRVQIAERTIQYPRYAIHGRHLVDTFLLAHFYDVATRELEGFELEEVAEHFDLSGLPATTIIGRLSDLLTPSYFVQAQIFPYNYQDVIVRGNATKIDALLLREYLHQRHAIPPFVEARFFAGGYTDMFHEGVVRQVWHADVQSLYPSLILAYDIKPRRDELDLFVSLLRDLRAFRLAAKTDARTAPDEATRRHFDALQQTFKILINSFYGYLGFSQGHFSDFDAAETVTARGREVLRTMLDWLRGRGAQVIEIDTDGLYFVPPPDCHPDSLVTELQTALPAGVEVEIDGQYPAMFSYKMKNYALLDEAGRLHVKGSALRSRGLEKFQRRFLEEMLTLALQDRADQIPALYATYCHAIEQRAWPIELLAKTDTLQDSLEAYREKIAKSARNRSAPYELALQSGQAYQPGDRVRYYITGDTKRVSAYENARLVQDWNAQHRDENVPYYLDKLHSLYKKFAPVIAKGVVTADDPVLKRARRPRPDTTGDLFDG